MQAQNVTSGVCGVFSIVRCIRKDEGYLTGLGTDKPHHLLLATDFSARCDRAQDRAVQLALQWNARLTAVHALGATDVPNDLLSRQGRPNAVERAKRLLEEEFAAIEGLRASVHVEQANPKTAFST